VFQLGTVSMIKDGKDNEIQISIQIQDRLVEIGQSWMARVDKVDGFVLEKVGVSHQGTDRCCGCHGHLCMGGCCGH